MKYKIRLDQARSVQDEKEITVAIYVTDAGFLVESENGTDEPARREFEALLPAVIAYVVAAGREVRGEAIG